MFPAHALGQEPRHRLGVRQPPDAFDGTPGSKAPEDLRTSNLAGTRRFIERELTAVRALRLLSRTMFILRRLNQGLAQGIASPGSKAEIRSRGDEGSSHGFILDICFAAIKSGEEHKEQPGHDHDLNEEEKIRCAFEVKTLPLNEEIDGGREDVAE